MLCLLGMVGCVWMMWRCRPGRNANTDTSETSMAWAADDVERPTVGAASR